MFYNYGMENSEQHSKQQFDWLKAYQWQKGQSGNPGGRPKKTLKVFAREFLESMSDEDRIDYFKTLNPEVVWKMAEGNPESKTDFNNTGNPIIVLSNEIANKYATPQSPSTDSK